MIEIFANSVRGTSHIKNGMPCQDSNKYVITENGWVIAAVADGVGSAVNSEIGAKIAAETAVLFCRDNLPFDQQSEHGFKRTIYTAYNAALKKIYNLSQKNNQPFESYDTTLSLVIYNGHKLHYGHSGDGGILGLTIYGEFVSITKRQKGDDKNSVVPLRFGEQTWNIDSYSGDKLASVLLATDGMLDGVFMPSQLQMPFVKNQFYAPLMALFMHPAGYAYNSKAYCQMLNALMSGNLNDDKVINSVSQWLNYIYTKYLLPQNADANGQKAYLSQIYNSNAVFDLPYGVTDDKTVLVLSDLTSTAIEPLGADYYAEPNWQELNSYVQRQLYGRTITPTPPIEPENIVPITDTSPIDPPTPKEIVQQEEIKQITEKRKGKKRIKFNWKVIAMIVVVVLLFIGAVVYIAYDRISSQQSPQTTITDTTTSGEQTETDTTETTQVSSETTTINADENSSEQNTSEPNETSADTTTSGEQTETDTTETTQTSSETTTINAVESSSEQNTSEPGETSADTNSIEETTTTTRPVST
jgi:flagellar basal body-associated protein FliL